VVTGQGSSRGIGRPLAELKGQESAVSHRLYTRYTLCPIDVAGHVVAFEASDRGADMVTVEPHAYGNTITLGLPVYVEVGEDGVCHDSWHRGQSRQKCRLHLHFDEAC